MEDVLTTKQAYAAMFDFIEQVFRRTNADSLGSLLGDMSTMSDGLPADSAIAEEWECSVNRAKKGEVDTGLAL
jgi:hypothetical protein